METIMPGISLKYVDKWGIWEAVRELTANARDTGAKFEVYKQDDKLIIRDYGNGISLHHLNMGESGSRDDKEKIGQFGEGLKTALVVLLRENKTVEILSKNRKIVPVKNTQKTIEKEKQEDGTIIEKEYEINTLSFMYEESEEFFNGTEIKLHGWEEEEDYQERFLNNTNPIENENVILTNTSGSILWEKTLYNQGVFIQDLENYAFGYNINNKDMNNRDRNVISESALHGLVGEIWAKVVDDIGWKIFFLSSQQKKMETLIRIYSYEFSTESKNSMIRGFHLAFGENAVLRTSDEAAAEAKHCGGKIIDPDSFGYYIRDLLKHNVLSDFDFVAEKKGKKAFNVPLSRLTPDQRKNLTKIKKMAKKVEFFGDVIVAEIPDFPAYYDPNFNCIKVRPDVLNYEEYARSMMVHELGHWYSGAVDLTDEHVKGCCDIAVKLMQ